MATLIGRRVGIETSEGKTYQGYLVGIDEKLNIIIDNVTGGDGKVFKLVLNGSFIKEVRLIEKPFELKSLAERLERVFPSLVKVREEIGAIIVMDKIKLTEKGVVEGSGLAAERAKGIYDEFVKQSKAQST
ncbi:MAG: Lsm family RNA-binding protein [Thaumarchaeota archaeon]|nr:Lsm family RNA-binding protein [Nitrososphaerota archaeon]